MNPIDPTLFQKIIDGTSMAATTAGSAMPQSSPLGAGLKGLGQGAQAGAMFGPVGAAIGGAAGLGLGLWQAHQQKAEEQRATAALQAARLATEMNYRQTAEQTRGSGEGYYRDGGLLSRSLRVKGGQFKPLSQRAVEVVGNSHEEGGVKVPGQPAEVEGGETIADDYVFSEALGFAQSHKKLMKAMGRIEEKAPTPERLHSLRDLMRREEELKQKQELLKTLTHG